MRTFAIAGALASIALAQDTSKDPKIERGRYLVEQVAKCQDCHTPKMDNGDFIRSQWMKGTTLGFTPAAPVPNWKSKAPDVSANSVIMKRWGEEGMVRFLETGKNPRGNKAGAPMPTYNLLHEDAEAVAAFLKSVE